VKLITYPHIAPRKRLCEALYVILAWCLGTEATVSITYLSYNCGLMNPLSLCEWVHGMFQFNMFPSNFSFFQNEACPSNIKMKIHIVHEINKTVQFVNDLNTLYSFIFCFFTYSMILYQL
jgi:hypothetical protein